MLSRSNSNAGDRLRRAKSTSSAHTTSSGHQRSSTSIDPFVIRQHAETAAVEAFQRAKQFEEPATLQAYRPVLPKLQGRRSQVTGRTQGSHFEDARLGRRRSTSKKDDSRSTKPAKAHQVPSEGPSEAPASETSDGEVVVTRKRSVIPPHSSRGYLLYDASSATAPNRNERRTSQAVCADGSPAPRRSSHGLPTPLQQCPQGSYFAGTGGSDQYAQSPKQLIGEMQRSDEYSVPAQTQLSQDSVSKKLRERKSFILAPFQRRRATNAHQAPRLNHDRELPPFNYADEGLRLLSPPPPPVYTAPALSISQEKRGQSLSDSLKGRFKKVFRKATRVRAVMPAQHIEAKHLHQPVTTPLSTPTVQAVQQEDPFTGIAGSHSQRATSDAHAGSATRHSSGEQSTAKSRVTSWTNSTAAVTWSTRGDLESHDAVDEQGRLTRSGSTSTLRKAGLFFGRPAKSSLRRLSRNDLSTSEESAGLYSALQERIRPAESASQTAGNHAESQSVRTSSALDTLPSRQRAESTISSRSNWQAATIRSVTPDPAAYRLDIPSPVAEVLSPEAHHDSRQEPLHEELTPRSQLQRRPAMEAPTPSKEQIERRIERSKNRWQSPLDELSPSAPRPSRHTMEENPYELRSLSRTLQQPLSNDLPHHAKVGVRQQPSVRPDVLSPSVYSCCTDGESPRPDKPPTVGGMVVTITGREVKSYAISPSKIDQPAERPIHASQDWRQWLSEEMNGWDGSTTPQDYTLPPGVLKETAIGAGSNDSLRKISQPRNSSASPSIEAPQTQFKIRDHRAHPSSRLSSYMNDRYPMIDTGRNSSDQSIGRRSRISSQADSRPATSGSVARPTAARDRKHSTESGSLKTALTRQRVVKKPRSMAELALSAQADVPEREASDRGSSTAAEADAKTILLSQDTNHKPWTAPARPRSAFDLRANFKTGVNSSARPLEVRRTTHASEQPSILEDSTIVHISAGPYATSSPFDAAAADKENVQPHPASEPTAALPALSSSEWLAAGTNKKREGQALGAVHPAYRNRSGSRYSPLRSGTGTPTSGLGGGRGSPGHRLATSWLDGKRSKENSPAFV